MNTVDQLFRDAKVRGYTMSAICSEAGIHPAQASRWRKGRVRPLLESYQALEEALERLQALEEIRANDPAPNEPAQSVTF